MFPDGWVSGNIARVVQVSDGEWGLRPKLACAIYFLSGTNSLSVFISVCHLFVCYLVHVTVSIQMPRASIQFKARKKKKQLHVHANVLTNTHSIRMYMLYYMYMHACILTYLLTYLLQTYRQTDMYR